MPSTTQRLSPALCVGLLALLACRANAQAGAPPGAQPGPRPVGQPALPPVLPLAIEPLAGQVVAVLPLTLLVADPTLESDSLYSRYRDRRAGLLRADSLVEVGFQTRGPEVGWVFPAQLRKIARRSGGFVADPDQMGQAILRAQNLKKVPDPLRSSLRGLMAVVGGRLALVPAALGFEPLPGGQMRASLSLVLADARNGQILWRTLTHGTGAAPDQALNAAMAAVLPVAGGP